MISRVCVERTLECHLYWQGQSLSSDAVKYKHDQYEVVVSLPFTLAHMIFNFFKNHCFTGVS